MFFTEYQKTANIFSLVETAGKREWEDTISTIDIFVQPASTEDSMMYEGDVSKSFVAYTREDTVKQTDRLVIDGETHEIRSIQKFGFGTVQHWKLFLEQSK